jgi:putative phosphoribosyl transferase
LMIACEMTQSPTAKEEMTLFGCDCIGDDVDDDFALFWGDRVQHIKKFRDRVHAGQLLAGLLLSYADEPNLLVLGLPRGGVPVAHEVARRLSADLDVFVVRKLGVPWQPELAMGAIGSGGICSINDEIVRSLGISASDLKTVQIREQAELERRESLFRGGRPPYSIAGRVIIIVDDGLATGATMAVAIQAMRSQNPRKIVVAVPVAPTDTAQRIRAMADDFICLVTPQFFAGVGAAYEDFSQTSNEDVMRILGRAPLHAH